MHYNEARSKLKSGDVVAFSHEGWSSWHSIKISLVRMFTKSEYSHVGVVVVIGGRVMILENVIPCVRLYPLSKTGDFYHIGMNIKWNKDIEEKAFSYIGNEYSQWAAIKAFFTDLGHGNTSECAALVDTVMRDAGIDMGTRQTPDSIVEKALMMGKSLRHVEND